jgi:excisionase family DNA binding protein
MKIEFEKQDIESIAKEIIKKIKPLSLFKYKSNDDTYFDIKGLAIYLKVSKKWVYANIKEMNIPHIKLKGHIRFKKSDIEKWIDSYNIPAINRIDRIVKGIKK